MRRVICRRPGRVNPEPGRRRDSVSPALADRPPARYVSVMQTLSLILVIVAALLVLGTLFAGLINMARGGPDAPRRSNAFMRYRVLFQGIAIVIFLIALALRNAG